MTSQPQVTNSIVGNPIKGYQSNSSDQFSVQYNTNEKLILGVGSMVLNHLRRPACLASEAGVHYDVGLRTKYFIGQNQRNHLILLHQPLG
ncbi:hypothetical protein CRYUN_Cryun05aG0108400 [Craigia yunnanensis]